MCIYLPGYCQRAGGVRTAFCTAALVTPIATVSGARGIMVELVPVKNMFWLSPGVAQPVKRSAESEPNALIACHTLRRCAGVVAVVVGCSWGRAEHGAHAVQA